MCIGYAGRICYQSVTNSHILIVILIPYVQYHNTNIEDISMNKLIVTFITKPCVLERFAYACFTICGGLVVWGLSDDITGYHRDYMDMIPYIVIVISSFFTSIMSLLLVSTFVSCPEIEGEPENTLNRYMTEEDMGDVKKRMALARRHIYRKNNS